MRKQHNVIQRHTTVKRLFSG